MSLELSNEGVRVDPEEYSKSIVYTQSHVSTTSLKATPPISGKLIFINFSTLKIAVCNFLEAFHTNGCQRVAKAYFKKDE